MSEGWGMHSGQSSPTSSKDFKKFVVIRVAGEDDKNKDRNETPGKSTRWLLLNLNSWLRIVLIKLNKYVQ